MRFFYESSLPFPPESVFAYRTRPGALARLTPPWQRVEIIDHTGTPPENGTLTLRIRENLLPPLRWVGRFSGYKKNAGYTETMLTGPFREWEHRRGFNKEKTGCRMEDTINYSLPLGPLGHLFHDWEMARNLTKICAFRHARTRMDIQRQRAAGGEPLKIILTGSHGFIGRNLKAFLQTAGHEVTCLVRKEPGKNQAVWNPETGEIDTAALEGCDAVIHLAGASIFSLWTKKRRAYLMKSRTQAVKALVAAIDKLKQPPSTLIVASALGVYGSRGNTWLEETDKPGKGFSAELCQALEAEAKKVKKGVRLVLPRIGVVLGRQGGMLGRMLPAFRLFCGSTMGTGHQYISWISLEDTIGALHHLLIRGKIAGPVNLGTPTPATAAEFSATLSRVLRRPCFLRIPEGLIQILLGKMGQSLLLSSTRMRPKKLEESGFTFLYPQLEEALRWEILGSCEQAPAQKG